MLMLTVLILKVVLSVAVEQVMKELVKLAQVNKYVDINNYVVNFYLCISKLLIFYLLQISMNV